MRVTECINRIKDNLTGERAHLLIVMGSFNSSQRLQELSYDHMHKEPQTIYFNRIHVLKIDTLLGLFIVLLELVFHYH